MVYHSNGHITSNLGISSVSFKNLIYSLIACQYKYERLLEKEKVDFMMNILQWKNAQAANCLSLNFGSNLFFPMAQQLALSLDINFETLNFEIQKP